MKKGDHVATWSKKEVWERRPEDRHRRDGGGDAKKTNMTPANDARSEDRGANFMLTVNISQN